MPLSSSPTNFIYLAVNKGKNKAWNIYPKSSGKIRKDAEKAIKHSIKKIFTEEKLTMIGITTASGTGGTLKYLSVDLE